MTFKYSQKQIQFLKDGFKRMPVKELTDAFNRQFELDKKSSHIRAALKNRKIKSGRTGQFAKGQTSWNAGTVGLMKANSGSFKPGQKPHNARAKNHERICSKDGYVLIRTDEKNPHTGHKSWYRLKHVVVWEKANGKIPKGMNLRFKDGDKTNCELKNLELVSRALNLRLNQNRFNDAPTELKPTIRTLSELEIKTFQSALAVTYKQP
jgi:HNH endonuclease